MHNFIYLRVKKNLLDFSNHGRGRINMATKMDLKEQLKEKLREIFQFEYEDLDFGIYRIMNYKRKEIEKFIEVDLIKEIENELKVFSEEELSKIKNGLENKKAEIEKTLGKEAFKDGEIKEEYKDTPIVEEYQKLKKQLENVELSEDLEKQVYNHLINFFSRYYDNGDFISKRRYSKNEKYMIPYNGEEVYLYWVNKDQYYIKTTEYFNKYTFYVENIFGNLTVNFRIVEAEEEKGNVKSQDNKYFILNEDIFDYDEEKKEINIFFEYRQLTEKEQEKYKKGNSVSQDLINEEILQVLEKKFPKNNIISTLFRKENEEDQNVLLRKHLNKYTRKNTTDYFIHKDLKGFLEKELDFYIKNEYLQMEDLKILGESEYFEKLKVYLISVRVFQNIAMKIIDFLNQIETFQKKVWEKKKFVIDTHYVISLDKIYEYCGEDFFHSILSKILSNKEQIQEWKNLFDIEVASEKDLVENPEKLNFDGEKYKKLPIDTKHFDEEFKWKLLIALTENNDLDEVLDGVLIKSENWQALNLLLNKYSEKVQTIYIDPPYNTGNDGFLYKDKYQHSSWLTMMENRLKLARKLMKDNGVIFNSIDYNENTRLDLLYKSLLNYVSDIAVKVKAPSGVASGGFIFDIKENILVYSKENPSLILPNINLIIKEQIDECSKTIKNYNLLFIDEGEEEVVKILELDNEKIEIKRHKNYKIENININELKKNGQVTKFYLKNFDKIFRTASLSGSIEKKLKKLFPDNELYSYYRSPSKGKWAGRKIKYYVYKKEQILWLKDTATIIKKGKKEVPFKLEQITNIILDDLWQGIANEGNVTLKEGKKPEKLLKMIIDLSSTNENLILDFFLGSGTTTAVAHKLGRRWIGIEMGEHFYTVVLPRMKKVLFYDKSGISKETDVKEKYNKENAGGFFKYCELEQFEDVL